MGILSSLLGLGEGKPTQVIPTTVAEPKIAAEIAPFLKDILGKGQALYKQRMKEGYEADIFPGKTLADVSADQLRAQEAVRGLVGTQAPGFAEARDLVRKQVTERPTAEALQPYMSPYQQAVVDIEQRKAQEKFESQILPEVRKAQIAAGAFGGTRGTMLEAQSLADQARLQADIQARGSQQAYQDAQQSFQQQKQREAMAAQGLTGLTTGEFGARLGEIRPLEAIGREAQQREQQQIDELYKKFKDRRSFEERQLGKYQARVSQVPISQSSVTYTPQQYQPSPLAQAMGVGTGIANIYGAFTNPAYNPIPTKEGGLIGRAEGGLASLPVVRRQDAGLIDSYPTTEELAAERAEVAKFKERERLKKGLEEIDKLEKDKTRRRMLEGTFGSTDAGGTGGAGGAEGIDPIELMMKQLALSPELFKSTDYSGIVKQMEKTQGARAARAEEELGTRQDLLNQARQQAQYNQRQAVLSGITKGLLSPTVGGTGIGMGIRQGLMGATGELEKVPDQSARLLEMELGILDKKSQSVYQAEKDKLDLMVAAGQMETTERTQRLANITALATLQNSIKSGKLADFDSLMKMFGNISGLPFDIAGPLKDSIKELPLNSEELELVLAQIDKKVDQGTGAGNSDIAKDSFVIEGGQ